MNKDFVIDANLLFSAVISGNELYKNLVLNYKFYSPDFCLTEIEKYENLILRKTKLPKEKLKEFTLLIFSRIIIVPRFLISNESIIKAFDLCKEVDKDDTIYLALSIELNIPLLTRDKILKDHIISRGYNLVMSFDEFIKRFYNNYQ